MFTAIKIFRWMLGVALILYSAYVLYLSQDDLFLPVKAKVIDSQKEYSTIIPTHRLPKTELVFEYTYDYNGASYQSTRYSHGPINSGVAIANYDRGDKLTVFISPEHPEYSVVERGTPLIIYGFLISGILMIINLSLEQVVSTLISKNKEPSERLQRCFQISGMMVGLSVLIIGVSYFTYQIVVAA